MSNDEIKELIQMVLDSGIAELELQRGDNRVRIRRSMGPMQDITIPATMTGHSPNSTSDSMSQATVVPAPSGIAAGPPPPAANEVIVKSPIVGTFYDAPKPGDPPFVKVGDSVEPGQVLCIIESMKLMNEIESELAGTVVAKLMENGRAVEYGEALFAIRPR
jgi:acetyl-CoA carboxylase biotin carboxyl carrier protein